MIATAMFVLVLVGFVVGAFAVACITKFIGGALKPTLPSLDAPVRKVVVRHRTVQAGSQAKTFNQESRYDSKDQSKLRPEMKKSGITEF